MKHMNSYMKKLHEFEDSYAEDNSQVEDDSQDQRGTEQIMQIDDAADCAGSLLSLDLACMKCDKRVSVAEHLHNLSPYSLHSMLKISAKAWHAILCLVTPWQYLPRLGMLFYISKLSHRGTLAVSAEAAWHAILYLVTPWQYLPRLGILFYILCRDGRLAARCRLARDGRPSAGSYCARRLSLPVALAGRPSWAVPESGRHGLTEETHKHFN